VLLVAALAGVAVVAAGVAGPWHVVLRDVSIPRLPQVPQELLPQPSPSPSAQPPATDDTGLDPLLVVLAVLVAVAAALALWYLATALRRRGGPGEVDEPVGDAVLGDALTGVPTGRELDEAVRRAERALADLPPGDAVVAAWMELERTAASGGIERDPAQTPTEFTLAVLDRTHADARAVRELLRLYLAARFSDHPVTDDDVRAARAALGRIGEAVRRASARADEPAPHGPAAAS
jgi:hypothetical protein